METERKYVLKKKTLIISDPQSNDLLMHGPRNDVFCIEENHRPFYTKLLELLREPSSTKELLRKLKDTKISLERSDLQSIIDELVADQIVELHEQYSGDVLSNLELDKYDRQLHFMASMGISMRDAFRAQEQLKNKHVVVLGVGGVGGHAAYALSVMGIGELTLIDQDHIELSNTSRQVLYDETDIGLFKVDVAKRKLSKYNRNLRINAINKSIKSKEDLLSVLIEKKTDLVVLAADTPRGEIQYIVDEVCHQLSIPFLHGGPAGGFVFVGPFIIPGKTKTLSQLIKTKYKLAPEFESINNEFVASIIEPYNAVAANLIVLEVFRFFTGMETMNSINRRHLLNMLDMSTSMEIYDA